MGELRFLPTGLLLSVFFTTPTAVAQAGPGPGMIHVVRSGETLWAIGRLHGIPPGALAAANRLLVADGLQIGQRLLISRPARSGARMMTGLGLWWPSRGVITSRFGFRGRRHHHGIDIAAPVGTPIAVARDGVVTFAGWRAGYGALVIVDHGKGLATWYSHASTILVTVGQRVQRGQMIARVGATGVVTGPNLHFEVRQNDRPLDPLAYLQTQW